MTELPSDKSRNIALYSKDGKEWSYQNGTNKPFIWEKNSQVTKIVIGVADNQYHDDIDLPDSLHRLFPRLTHLHLWGVMGKRSLGRLPEGLICLDIRNSTKLAVISNFPSCLETLILKDCPSVSFEDRDISNVNRLSCLDVSGSISIPQNSLSQLLAANTNLRSLETAQCKQLKMIRWWPEKLESIVLNGCTSLSALPPIWPVQLRKLEISGATKVKAVPDFPETLDYIDLSHTHSLTRLPSNIGTPSTLYLHDSALLAPPASEHGNARQNVAQDTVEFFKDLTEFGAGSVKRCKVQMLGNGAAGKTSLSLLLTGQEPHLAKELGSTHGVRFDATTIDTEIEGLTASLDLQVWDFGGQEIYHGTHRLFMSKGSVFVILWKPEQDGCQPPESTSGYKDEWRPLKYWIDLVKLSCRAPSIAVVCSHASAQSDKLLQRYQSALGSADGETPPLYCIDSEQKSGQIDLFNDWLLKSTTDIVLRQGQVVPSYWEVAQDMVLEWLQSMKANDRQSMVEEQITLDDFSRKLEVALKSPSNANKYTELTKALRAEKFSLTSSRIRRTLSFLTHSGWLYWSASLFEERVIVGQQWALDGLYMILERRDHERVYDSIKRNKGVFTRTELDELQWKREGLSQGDQKLLLSYMQMCDMCFKLRDGKDAWLKESVYQSIEHLPTAEEARLVAQFDNERPDLSISYDSFSSDKAHSFHWRQFLALMGEHFGVVASYASDGIVIRADQNRLALILFKLSDEGIGAELTIQVSGVESDQLLKELRSQLISIFPLGYYTRVENNDSDKDVKVNPQDELIVFVSYAWRDKKWQDGDPDPELPVQEIKDYFNQYNKNMGDNGRKVRLLIDKDVMSRLDSIDHYIRTATKSPRVIAVHSSKYFKSVNCVYEIHLLKDREDAFMKVVTPVEFDSGIGKQSSRDEYLAHWREGEFDVPSRMNWNKQDAQDFGVEVVRFCSTKFSDANGYNIRWEGDGHEALKEIVFRLRLTPSLKD